MSDNKVAIKNKRARYEYELLDKYTAGLQLLGTEIKSIREGKASIAEGYCTFEKGELFIYNMHIAPYERAGFENHDSKRKRKLLLQKKELKKLEKKLQNQGLTIVPTLLFISDSGYAKLNIALAKGKKLHDKRDTMKDRDVKKQIERTLKS